MARRAFSKNNVIEFLGLESGHKFDVKWAAKFLQQDEWAIARKDVVNSFLNQIPTADK